MLQVAAKAITLVPMCRWILFKYDYLQDLNDKFTPKNEDRTQLWQSILDSTVSYELKSAGYKTVALLQVLLLPR